MRLSMKEVQKQHESVKKLYEQGLAVAPVDVKRVLDLYDTIEALQQENEQLKADCDRMLGEVQELTMEYNYFKERLQISPYGDDEIDELDEALENCKFQYEQLKQENKHLRAQLDEWKYEVKCHMDEVVARDKEIEKLRAQAAEKESEETGMIYHVECPKCGFGFDLFTDDEDIKSELEECNCGGKRNIKIEGERND